MEVKFDSPRSSTLQLGGSRSSVEKLILPLVESRISTPTLSGKDRSFELCGSLEFIEKVRPSKYPSPWRSLLQQDGVSDELCVFGDLQQLCCWEA